MSCGCSKHLTEAQKQEVLNKYKAGFNANLIAAQMGIHKEAVLDVIANPVVVATKTKKSKIVENGISDL